MKPMPTLSLAMIVRNEAANLSRCLVSVEGLCNEIIVVDTGSTDTTLEIAQRFKARVGHFPWVDDFAAARNAALDLCTGDWVLILDADETIDRLDHPAIRAALGCPGAEAYRLTLRNYYAGGGQTVQGVPPTSNTSPYSEGSNYSHYADGLGLRLCRRVPGLAFEGRIHELLDPCFQRRGSEILTLPAVIHHFGKVDEAREAQKRRYYLDLARQEAQAHPESPQYQFNLLQQAMNADDWPTVQEAATAYLRLIPEPHPLVLLGAGMALQFQGRHLEALTHLQRLLSREPHQAQALTRLAVSCAALGRLDEARQALDLAIQAQPGFIVPYVNRAELESQQGHAAAARASLQAGLACNARDPQLLHALVQLSIAEGNLDQAVADAQVAIQRCPQGGMGVWHRLTAFHHLAHQRYPEARQFLDLGLTAFPGNPDLERLRGMIPRG